jgi:ferritin-like metal-binding protein YciE
MNITNLKQLYLAELQEARSFEEQIANAFAALAERASHAELKAFLKEDAPEARGHRDRIAGLLEGHSADPGEHEDQTMRTILAGARDWADQIDEPSARDAALIAAIQRVQHYEIAVFGALAEWARQLGLKDLDTLTAILDEEKKADAKLTEIARNSINRDAA